MENNASGRCGVERKGIKMEWCEKIYEEWRSEEGLRRLERAAAVLILLVLAVIGIEDESSGIPELTDGYPVVIGAGAAGSALSGSGAALSDIAPAAIHGADEILCKDIKTTFESISGEVSVKPEKALKAEAGTGEIPTVTPVPEEPKPSVPVISIPETAVPVLPEDETTPAFPVEEFPEENLPEESVPENSTSIINGFLVDSSGMLCGIADPAVISDGYLVLPAEGCTGISVSAFADASALITEIYIPANITRIEEGAFACLSCLEWLEAEGSDACFTEDGVLFSENGTCILGFPSARTGSYKVPQRVTRFAADAFAAAQIETLDAVGCSLSDTGNLPSSIRLLLSEDLAG